MRKWGLVGAGFLLFVGLVAAVVAAYILRVSRGVDAGADLADLLKSNPDEYAMSLGHVLDLTPRAIGMFRVPLSLFAGSWLVGTAVSFRLRWMRKSGAANWVLAIMMIPVLTAVHTGLVDFSPILSSKALAIAIEKHWKPSDVIVINGAYEDGSTLNFYTHKNIHILNHREEGNVYNGALYPDAPPIFEDDASMQKLWNSPTRVFVWTEDEKASAIERLGPHYEIAGSGGKLILSNQPN